MEIEEINFVVIGSGPSGYSCAIQASKMGKSVVVIEAWKAGGFSLWTGTVPSKSLREAILDLTNFRNKSFYAASDFLSIKGEITIPNLIYRKDWTIKHLMETTKRQLIKNQIKLVNGKARFAEGNIIEVTNEEEEVIRIFRPQKVLISTGSRPYVPDGIPVDVKNVFTSTGLLEMEEIPKSMIVIGAGVIGCEYACMMSILGAKVTLVDKRESILSFLDREIASHLLISMEENGLLFISGKGYENVQVKGDDDVVVTLDDGSELTADTALIAAGREANVGDLNLEAVGLTTSESGYLEVNEFFQTSNEQIYAAGDVIGGASLSSTGIVQGRIAALNAWGSKQNTRDQIFPIGIYTIPEISSIGRTEEELQEEGVEYEIGRAYYYEVSRSVITGSENGLLKLIFDPKTLQILGAHIIGRGATELIHIAQLAISFNAKIDYFIEEVFNFPTFAEMYRISALNGMNKLKDS